MEIFRPIITALLLLSLATDVIARQPPPEAIAACAGRPMGATCEFMGHGGFARGVCNDRPGMMACAPDRGPPDGSRDRPPPPPPTLAAPSASTPRRSAVTQGAHRFKLEAWADNWFAAYLGERLVVEDSVPITTERSFNAESVLFSADYPLQLNFILKDFKQNDTGLEYIGRPNQQMGDGGFIMQVTDLDSGEVVAVSDGRMKCFVAHRAPLNRACAAERAPVAGQPPCEFQSLPQPEGWMSSGFDDGSWQAATVHSEASVRPKGGYDAIRWSPQARLVWGEDLERDNTLLCRLTVEGETGGPVGTSPQGSYREQVYAAFGHFATQGVSVAEDGDYYRITSDGVPAGELMVGIRSWQQQVPLPQPYAGDNAWPLVKQPEPAAHPISLAHNFTMGAVGIAADGTPIFNPLNNRGEDAFLAGELDHFGGHSGRADDYHYHIAPTHLTEVVGDGTPIAFMLDGYPLYGFHEPGGHAVDYATLDEHRGHDHDGLGYHYHASPRYPYVNRDMHGEVTLTQDRRDGATFITPQARTFPIRPHLEPLRGAEITGFSVDNGKTRFALTYRLRDESHTLRYRLEDGIWIFEIPNHDGSVRTERYQAVALGGGRFTHPHEH